MEDDLENRLGPRKFQYHTILLQELVHEEIPSSSVKHERDHVEFQFLMRRKEGKKEIRQSKRSNGTYHQCKYIYIYMIIASRDFQGIDWLLFSRDLR
jgi:hypothetical protein